MHGDIHHSVDRCVAENMQGMKAAAAVLNVVLVDRLRSDFS